MNAPGDSFTCVWLPRNSSELACCKLILDRLGVIYHTMNEYDPIVFTGAEQIRVMVQADRAEECLAALEKELVGRRE